MSRQVNLGQIIPNIQVGETITGNAGTQANVENTGTNLNPILNFTIPKGATGSAGKDGKDGADAKINGVNTLTLEAGTNITLDQQGDTLTINSTASGGTSDYSQLTNKPSINSVTLNGNKSLNDLGIQPKGNYIEDNNYVHTDNNFNTTYKNKLEGLENYDDTEIKATLPTTTGEGQNITLDKTAELEFKKPPLPMGNSEQNGEPRPDNEVFITNVTGNVEVTISNENNTESKTLPVSLGNIELCKIGDYQDYFYKESNKWYLHKEINKVVFNGSESWNYNVQNNVAYLQLTTKFSSRKGLFSNLFSYYNADWTAAPDNTISEATSSSFIFIKSTVASDNTAWKSWLSTHNTIVYYVLATPTDTEITDTILISQLEAINNTTSYEEQTNISNNQIALFNVEAYQNTKIILDEKYTKPNTGIPKTDLASAVQTSLGKADTAIQSSDLTNYVTKTDYATSSTGGVIKVSNGDYGIAMDDGVLKGTVRTYAQYNSMSSKGIVCKGTLENVLTGKGLNQIVTLTQQEYDALVTKDSNTYYYIVEE